MKKNIIIYLFLNCLILNTYAKLIMKDTTIILKELKCMYRVKLIRKNKVRITIIKENIGLDTLIVYGFFGDRFIKNKRKWSRDKIILSDLYYRLPLINEFDIKYLGNYYNFNMDSSINMHYYFPPHDFKFLYPKLRYKRKLIIVLSEEINQSIYLVDNFIKSDEHLYTHLLKKPKWLGDKSGIKNIFYGYLGKEMFKQEFRIILK